MQINNCAHFLGEQGALVFSATNSSSGKAYILKYPSLDLVCAKSRKEHQL